MNKEIRIGLGIKSIVALQGFLTAAMVVWACVNVDMFYAAIGMLTMFIILFPFLLIRSYDIFCPWSFVILTVGLFSAPQAICMSFLWPNIESVERMMLLGADSAYFHYPAAVFLLGFVCLTYGYFGFSMSSSKRIVIARKYLGGKFPVVLTATFLFAVLATFAYIRFTGGLESGRISDKRATIKTLDVQGDGGTQQYGYLRLASKLASGVFMILYSYFLTRNQKLSSWQILIVGIAFLAACALPFYASSRGQVSWVIINGLGVSYYLGRGSFALKCLIVLVVGLSVFMMMSALRNRDAGDAFESASTNELFEKLVLNRNGPGLSKTAHIMNHVPEPLNFKYGETFAVWLLAPIPRDLYPNKPLIGTGPIIGTTIYGNKTSGVPPGFIAELYWNFHIPGVIFGMLLLGMGLKKIYVLFRDSVSSPTVIVPVYLFAIVPIAFSVLGHSLGFGLVMRVIDLIVIGAVVFMASTPTTLHETNFDGAPL